MHADNRRHEDEMLVPGPRQDDPNDPNDPNDRYEGSGRGDTAPDLVTDQPDVRDPDMREADMAEPGMRDPDMGEPDMREPDMREPGLTGVTSPEAAAPYNGSPDGESLRPAADDRWRDVQAGFVDDPRAAVERADDLLKDLLQEVTRQTGEMRERWTSENDTEQLRLALREYRSAMEHLMAFSERR
ncbi:hypothetical protein [Nonomuraea typhae]|uniref:hypothetical protein n=1 Tax=Nonomuraea typhae TaxID=2603600 RepID=UPI0012F77063|nr:hypothetical protein [Nonomuraea typhae]